MCCESCGASIHIAMKIVMTTIVLLILICDHEESNVIMCLPCKNFRSFDSLFLLLASSFTESAKPIY